VKKKKKKKKRGSHWSKAEDKLLKSFKAEGGEGGSWEVISQSFDGRDARSCQHRYNDHLNDGEKRARGADWSKANDVVLKSLKREGKSWETIAKSFPGRDAISCRNRYHHHLNDGEKIVYVAWSKEHDKLLKSLKAKGGSWEEIAASFDGRTAGACRDISKSKDLRILPKELLVLAAASTIMTAAMMTRTTALLAMAAVMTTMTMRTRKKWRTLNQQPCSLSTTMTITSFPLSFPPLPPMSLTSLSLFLHAVSAVSTAPAVLDVMRIRLQTSLATSAAACSFERR
jgi:hypothetical protein